MGLKCGIVGLPNVGKSTLFNCLSNAKAQAANFPFCTIEPNLGVITVPDERLNKLCALGIRLIRNHGNQIHGDINRGFSIIDLIKSNFEIFFRGDILGFNGNGK